MVSLFDYDRYNLIMESSFEFKGYDFLFFSEGVPFYSLFRTSRKLNSFWEVKYVGEVLLHLNPNIKQELFCSLMIQLTDREAGHVIRTYSKKRIYDMCNYIYNNKKNPYVRRYRRIIFNPAKQIPIEEKRWIIGKLISKIRRGKKITEELIYNAYEELSQENIKITYIKLANKLNCTRQTISNNITEDIKEAIKYHNLHLHFV